MQIKVRLDSRLTQRWAKHFSKQTLLRAARMMGPTLVALAFAGVAHTARAQGTISFSGAQTFMQTVHSRFAYVSLSRASLDARIFTDDVSAIASRLSHEVGKISAIDFSQTVGKMGNEQNIQSCIHLGM
jgi:hypothetical protein